MVLTLRVQSDLYAKLKTDSEQTESDLQDQIKSLLQDKSKLRQLLSESEREFVRMAERVAHSTRRRDRVQVGESVGEDALELGIGADNAESGRRAATPSKRCEVHCAALMTFCRDLIQMNQELLEEVEQLKVKAPSEL